MKIHISYLAAENSAANAVLDTLKRILPPVRVHETDNKPPFIHVYLTTRNSANPRADRENV